MRGAAFLMNRKMYYFFFILRFWWQYLISISIFLLGFTFLLAVESEKVEIHKEVNYLPIFFQKSFLWQNSFLSVVKPNFGEKKQYFWKKEVRFKGFGKFNRYLHR